MTALTEEMYQIFDRDEFSFKKIKATHTPDEVDQLKAQFKTVWQVWKKVNQSVATRLSTGQFTKVHVESWTNGWNLRDHYWAAFRLVQFADANPCIGVMLDKKQLQIYLMFQHYKSDQRSGTIREYNQLLTKVPQWSQQRELHNWYLWDKDDMEYDAHLPLLDYLNNVQVRQQFNQRAEQTSFLLGKFAFRRQDKVANMEEFIADAIMELKPLYMQL